MAKSIQKKCEYCDNAFMALQYKVNKGLARFCSFQCGRKSLTKQIERICLICAKTFSIKPSQLTRDVPAGKYCSKECQYEGRKSDTKCKCQNCQKEFLRKQWEVNQGENKFCSHSCSTIFMNNQRPIKSIEESFLENIIYPDNLNDCWIFKKLNAEGYGRINKRINKEKKVFLAHRFSYEHHIGPISNGLLVCHKCDNPRCVNPKHLFLGTTLDNTRDMIAKGRASWQKRKQTTES